MMEGGMAVPGASHSMLNPAPLARPSALPPAEEATTPSRWLRKVPSETARTRRPRSICSSQVCLAAPAEDSLASDTPTPLSRSAPASPLAAATSEAEEIDLRSCCAPVGRLGRAAAASPAPCTSSSATSSSEALSEIELAPSSKETSAPSTTPTAPAPSLQRTVMVVDVLLAKAGAGGGMSVPASAAMKRRGGLQGPAPMRLTARTRSW
mmetsp:Transcript_8888/g.26253  ORF Transcript_8888/g.26253 Transcript_8888/m.26253 type:complete len:209 (-) Transcript_8888:65-691(-)